MPNIVLMGATYSDVPAVNLPVEGGGLAKFNYGWNYIGEDAELISPSFSADYTLADTTISSWTPSTTAKTIKASVTAGTFSANMTEYDYLIRWICEFRAVYVSGATLKVIPYHLAFEGWQALIRRPNALSYTQAENMNSNACLTYVSVPVFAYYNSSGTLTQAFSASYGIYPTLTASTFSSSTSATPTVTVKTPAITARCSTTYMNTSRVAELDSTSTFKTRGEVYRVKKSAMQQMYSDTVHLFANPL